MFTACIEKHKITFNSKHEFFISSKTTTSCKHTFKPSSTKLTSVTFFKQNMDYIKNSSIHCLPTRIGCVYFFLSPLLKAYYVLSCFVRVFFYVLSLVGRFTCIFLSYQFRQQWNSRNSQSRPNTHFQNALKLFYSYFKMKQYSRRPS